MTLPVPSSMDPELQARALANLGDAGAPPGGAPMPLPADVAAPPVAPMNQVEIPLLDRPPVDSPPLEAPQGFNWKAAAMNAIPGLGLAANVDEYFRYKGAPTGASPSMPPPVELSPPPAQIAPSNQPAMPHPSSGGAAGGAGGSGSSSMSAQEGRLLASFDAEKAAKEAEKAAITGKLAVEAEGKARQGDMLARQAGEMKEFDDHVNQAVDSEISSMRAQMEDIRNTKIDPMHFFSSKTDGQKAAFVLIQMASGIAGAFQTLGKGENPAITQLNRTMDRDMAAQEANLKNKHTALQAQNTIFGQMVQKFGMSRETKLKYQVMALESFKTHLEGEMATASGPIAQAQIQGNIAAIDQAQQQKGLEIVKAAQARAAAGYAAQKAAQQQAFENSLKLMHAQNEANKSDAEAAKLRAEAAGGGDGSKTTPVERYGKELVEKKIPQALSTIEHAKANLPAPGQDIPGVGPIASHVPDLLVGEDGRAARQQLSQLFNAYRVVVTGAGASVEELNRLERAAMGAKTTRELWEFINAGQDATNAAKAGIDKQFSPAVRAQYEANAAGPPKSLKPGG